MEDHQAPGEAVRLPIGDVLDLHSFPPADIEDLVAHYLDEAAARGLRYVRIVHGKGKGVQQRVVHAVCAAHPCVVGHRLAGEDAGGWGATLVELRVEAR